MSASSQSSPSKDEENAIDDPYNTTGLLAAAAESIQHKLNDDFETCIIDAVDGVELNNVLSLIPRSVFADGQSHTYNRVIKVLIREGFLGMSFNPHT